MIRAFLTALLISGGLAAQDFVYLNGFSSNAGPPNSTFPAARFKDLDGDGSISESSEMFPFLKTSFNTRNSSGSFVSDLEWVQEGDTYAFYFSDAGDGRIMRGVDVDNNGLLEPSEVTEFFDLMTRFAPEGIAVRRDLANNQTIVYVATDDQSNSPGIHRLVDLNNDGDAFDGSESSIIVDASRGLSVPGRSGTVNLVNDWWYSVEVLASGKIVAYNAGPSKMSGGGGGAQGPDMFCWYSFTDNNGAPANFQVFFNPSRINGIATHTDFDVGGTFPQWDIQLDQTVDPNLHPTWSNVPYLTEATRTIPGPKSYYFSSTYQDRTTNGFSGNNPQGVLVSGLFYRWLDANGSETIDATEITLWANISNAPVAGVPPFSYVDNVGSTIRTLNNLIYGLQASGPRIHLCWNNAGAGNPGDHCIVTMEDANNNGIIDTGEAFQAYFYSGQTNSVYRPPYSPYLDGSGSFQAFDDAFLPGPFQPGQVPYGQGCPQPVGGISPVAETLGGRPNVGNTGYGFSVIRAVPGFPCFMLTGITRTNTGLGFLNRPDCRLLSDIALGAFSAGFSDPWGAASLTIPIPNTPALAGSIMNTQWVVLDTGNQVISMSNGLEITIQP